MDFKVEGKVALVTGGSHGIGRAIAHALSEEGCRVAICARRPDKVNAVVEELKSKGGRAIGVGADAMVPEDTENVFAKLIEEWGTIHILVNNVGGGGRWGKPSIEETEDNVWIDVFNKNAMAAVRFTRLAIPFMRMQKWGRVVTIASMYGKEGGGRPWFTMAKSAEISLMKTLAMSSGFSGAGITFNTVSPGRIMIPDTGWESEMKKNPEDFARMIHESLPQGRMGTPEEVAAVVAFLCSEKSSLVNGANIAADGGEGRSF